MIVFTRMPWILVVCLGLLGTTSALAQTIGVYGSRVESDDIDTLYGIGLQITVPITETIFASAQATSYPDYQQTRGVGPQQVPLALDADFIIGDLGLGWRAAIHGMTFFHAGAGLTYLWTDAEYTLAGQSTEFELENDAGWYATLGLSTGGRLQGFLELQYRNLDGEISGDGIPPGFDSLRKFELKHVAANLGVRYTW